MELKYSEILENVSKTLEVEEDISLETLEELMNGRGDDEDNE